MISKKEKAQKNYQKIFEEQKAFLKSEEVIRENRRTIEKLIGFKLGKIKRELHSKTIKKIINEYIEIIKKNVLELSVGNRFNNIHFNKEMIARSLLIMGLPSNIIFEYLDSSREEERKAIKKIRYFFKNKKKEYKKEVAKTKYFSPQAKAKILKDNEI